MVRDFVNISIRHSYFMIYGSASVAPAANSNNIILPPPYFTDWILFSFIRHDMSSKIDVFFPECMWCSNCVDVWIMPLLSLTAAVHQNSLCGTIKK